MGKELKKVLVFPFLIGKVLTTSAVATMIIISVAESFHSL